MIRIQVISLEGAVRKLACLILSSKNDKVKIHIHAKSENQGGKM